MMHDLDKVRGYGNGARTYDGDQLGLGVPPRCQAEASNRPKVSAMCMA